ncbi:MAG: hypothetical protein FWB98_07335 [Defluviitaleaceae bacterium]|nr:hypothetical protein [Defluviitaleaceae bacterium]
MIKKQPNFVTKMKSLAVVTAAVATTAVMAQTAFALTDDYNFYIGNEYTEEFEQPVQFRTTDPLRLRTGPSTDHSIILVMPAGTIIEVPSFNPYSLFNPVILGDLNGYVATNYIVPVTNAPQASAASLTTTHRPPNGNVELLSWSYLRTALPMHTHIQVYDIWSGRTYTVRNFSNGNHADVEPLTANDTEIIRSINGGRFTWDPRPVIVSWGDRTVAAAINSMPHAGWTIQGNNFNGHICLHFYGSRTHNGNRSYEAQMQQAVMQAFNHAR